MPRRRRNRPGRGRSTGFTLVELMVSIAVIAVLLGLLAPALQSARHAAQDLKCLSNQRQIGIGWVTYTNDYKRFPHGPLEYVQTENGQQTVDKSRIPRTLDWGGVDWYEQELQTPFNKQRPLNPYVGSDSQQEKARAEIFQCPRDNATKFYATGENHHEYSYGGGSGQVNLVEESAAFDSAETTYGVIGTSYRANEWIWIEVGDKNGWHHYGEGTPTVFFGNVTWNNKPVDVRDPSRFVLTGDYGSFLAGRMTEEGRLAGWGIQFGWWHGVDVCNIAYFDGSARRTVLQPGKAVAADYSFYLDPVLHEPWSVVIGWTGTGSPPPPEEDEEE